MFLPSNTVTYRFVPLDVDTVPYISTLLHLSACSSCYRSFHLHPITLISLFLLIPFHTSLPYFTYQLVPLDTVPYISTLFYLSACSSCYRSLHLHTTSLISLFLLIPFHTSPPYFTYQFFPVDAVFILFALPVFLTVLCIFYTITFIILFHYFMTFMTSQLPCFHTTLSHSCVLTFYCHSCLNLLFYLLHLFVYCWHYMPDLASMLLRQPIITAGSVL